MSAKFSDFLTLSLAFGTDLYFKIHTTSLTTSALPCPLPPSEADIISGHSQMKIASLEVVRNLVADLDDVRVAEHARGRVLLGRHAVDLDDRLEHPLGVQPLLVRHNYPPRPFRAAVHFEGRHSALLHVPPNKSPPENDSRFEISRPLSEREFPSDFCPFSDYLIKIIGPKL